MLYKSASLVTNRQQAIGHLEFTTRMALEGRTPQFQSSGAVVWVLRVHHLTKYRASNNNIARG